jgi:hypothetical protein
MDFVSDKANFRRNTGGISRKFNDVWRNQGGGAHLKSFICRIELH